MIIHKINMKQKIKKYINGDESLLDMQIKIERKVSNRGKNKNYTKYHEEV